MNKFSMSILGPPELVRALKDKHTRRKRMERLADHYDDYMFRNGTRDTPLFMEPADEVHALAVLTRARYWKHLPAELKRTVWDALKETACFWCGRLAGRYGVCRHGSCMAHGK